MVEQPLKEEKPLKISTPSEIKALKTKADKGEVLEFPSGLVARLKRPKLAVMIKEGIIPKELLTTALQVAGGQQVSNPNDVGKAMEIIEIMLINSFVEPKIVKENPTDSEISINDLSDDDRGFAVTYAQDGEAGLSRFRQRIGKG